MSKTRFHIVQSFKFGEVADLVAWSIVDIQIMRTGKRNHRYYWPFEVTSETLDNVVRNFDNNVRGVDIAVDENHEYDHKAMGWYRRLYRVGTDDLWATIELTEYGAEILRKWTYKYFSPEIVRNDIDEETGNEIKDLLIGGAFTNRPFFKKMVSLQASESTAWQEWQDNSTFIYFDCKPMDKIKSLLESYKDSKTLKFNQKFDLKMAFNELPEEEKTQVQDAVDTELAKPEVGTPEAKAADADTPPPASATADTDKVPAEQYNEVLKQKNELEKQIVKSDCERMFSEKLAFSETNKSGIFNASTQKDSAIAFLMSLSSEQRAKFSDLVAGIDKSVFGIFGEVGRDGDDTNSEEKDKQQKYHEAVTKLAQEKNIEYHEATKLISYNDFN